MSVNDKKLITLQIRLPSKQEYTGLEDSSQMQSFETLTYHLFPLFQELMFQIQIQTVYYIIYMNSKKDSKRIKQKQERNFLSPVPRRKINGNEASPNDLQDLSPYRPVYGSHSLSRHPPLSNTEMTFIITPVPKTPKPIIDDLSEQQQRSIEGVISFGTENDDDLSGYEEDSEINQLFEEETEKGEEKGGKLNPEKADHKPGNHYLRTAEPKQKKESSKKSSQPATDNTKKVICNCKKTKCLKLYCDCFRINQICDGCNCVGCHNLPMYNQQRNNSMMSLMDRNPQAFKPKIDDEQHAKGCHCKKSNCLKKYCQCYQAGLKCGSNCKCEECKNKSEEDEDHRREGNNSMNSLIVNIEQLMKEDEEKQYKDKITGKVIKNKKDKVEPESVRI